jgi:hypothetical protein
MSNDRNRNPERDVMKNRLAFGRAQRLENKLHERRGESPPVPAALQGRATPEEVQRWTTYLPTKPPGRGT